MYNSNIPKNIVIYNELLHIEFILGTWILIIYLGRK